MSGDFETHEMNQPKISYLKERSEEELLEEEIRNQQTVDIFIESDKNWCWSTKHFKGLNYEFKNIPILNSK